MPASSRNGNKRVRLAPLQEVVMKKVLGLLVSAAFISAFMVGCSGDKPAEGAAPGGDAKAAPAPAPATDAKAGDAKDAAAAPAADAKAGDAKAGDKMGKAGDKAAAPTTK